MARFGKLKRRATSPVVAAEEPLCSSTSGSPTGTSSRPSKKGSIPTFATGADGGTRRRSVTRLREFPSEPSRAEYDAMIACTMSEDAHQGQIVRALKALGWITYHTRDSRGSDRGFPDLTAIDPKGTRHVVIEFKRQTGAHAVLTTDQVAWLDSMAMVRDSGNSGIEVYGAVRPLDSDALMVTLTQGWLVRAALHQWCLSEMCERCIGERARAKMVHRISERRRKRVRHT